MTGRPTRFTREARTRMAPTPNRVDGAGWYASVAYCAVTTVALFDTHAEAACAQAAIGPDGLRPVALHQRPRASLSTWAPPGTWLQTSVPVTLAGRRFPSKKAGPADECSAGSSTATRSACPSPAPDRDLLEQPARTPRTQAATKIGPGGSPPSKSVRRRRSGNQRSFWVIRVDGHQPRTSRSSAAPHPRHAPRALALTP